MSSNRAQLLTSILKGVLIATGFTLVGMLIIAVLTVFLHISDSLLTALNQILKIISILMGVRIAVGRGGQRGFVTGAIVAMIYMIAGYGVYVSLGGVHSAAAMLGEILLGAATGALCGAILANLSPKRRRAR